MISSKPVANEYIRPTGIPKITLNDFKLDWLLKVHSARRVDSNENFLVRLQ